MDSVKEFIEIEALKALPPKAINDLMNKLYSELVAIKEVLHYPKCWDTMAYPTLLDAIIETNSHPCPSCNPSHVPEPVITADMRYMSQFETKAVVLSTTRPMICEMLLEIPEDRREDFLAKCDELQSGLVQSGMNRFGAEKLIKTAMQGLDDVVEDAFDSLRSQ